MLLDATPSLKAVDSRVTVKRAKPSSVTGPPWVERLTSPLAAVQFKPHTHGTRMIAVRNDSYATSDDWRVDFAQFGDVGIAVAKKHLLMHKQTRTTEPISNLSQTSHVAPPALIYWGSGSLVSLHHTHARTNAHTAHGDDWQMRATWMGQFRNGDIACGRHSGRSAREATHTRPHWFPPPIKKRAHPPPFRDHSRPQSVNAV